MLYLPHENEEDLLNQINQAKSGGKQTWDLFVNKITHVKSQVMEFLEDNEEARLMASELFIDDNLTGEFMNPEGEQEMEDNQLDEFVQQEEFEHLDPTFSEPPAENVFEIHSNQLK